MHNNKLRRITALIGIGVHFAISLILSLLSVNVLEVNSSLTCLGLFTSVSHVCFFIIFDIMHDRDSFLAKVGKFLLGLVAFAIAALPIFVSIALMITEEISYFYLTPLEGMWAVAVIVSFILHYFTVYKNGYIEVSAFAAPLSLIISYKERINRFYTSRNALSFSVREVFADAKVKLRCSEVCATHK